jgi:hypothetical protein
MDKIIKPNLTGTYLKIYVFTVMIKYMKIMFFPGSRHHRTCNMSNMTGATSGTGTAYTSGSSKFVPCFYLGTWCSICSIIHVCIFFLQYCDDHNDFHVKMMFGSSLPVFVLELPW